MKTREAPAQLLSPRPALPHVFTPAAPQIQRYIPPQPWEQLWASVWQGAMPVVSNEVAVTLRPYAACQGNLQFDVLVRNVILERQGGGVGTFA